MIERPMKVEIIVDPTRIPPPPLASRVAPAPEKKGGAAKGAAAVSTYVWIFHKKAADFNVYWS